MTKRLFCGSAVFVALTLAVPGFSATIIASGAGSTLATAQNLTNLYPTDIIGTLDGTNPNAVSIFKISNLQPSLFSAITILPNSFGIPDTVLSLFNSSGVGVLMNDDISGANTRSCISSGGAGNPCPTAGVLIPAGVYYLAISRGANYPVDSLGNEIFNPNSSTDLVGPSSKNLLAGWDGGGFASPNFDLVNYDIRLTGTAPEPATWLLLSAGGLVLGLMRKRR